MYFVYTWKHVYIYNVFWYFLSKSLRNFHISNNFGTVPLLSYGFSTQKLFNSSAKAWKIHHVQLTKNWLHQIKTHVPYMTCSLFTFTSSMKLLSIYLMTHVCLERNPFKWALMRFHSVWYIGQSVLVQRGVFSVGAPTRISCTGHIHWKNMICIAPHYILHWHVYIYIYT